MLFRFQVVKQLEPKIYKKIKIAENFHELKLLCLKHAALSYQFKNSTCFTIQNIYYFDILMVLILLAKM